MKTLLFMMLSLAISPVVILTKSISCTLNLRHAIIAFNTQLAHEIEPVSIKHSGTNNSYLVIVGIIY